MKIVKAGFEIVTPMDGMSILRQLEHIGRVCYKSEERITEDSCIPFIQRIIKNGHEAMLEHAWFTVKFICDRGVSHEIVRHRLVSYAQESTRYCNYGNDDKGCTFIQPCFWPEVRLHHSDGEYTNYGAWRVSCEFAEKMYLVLLANGAVPQEARSVLPNSLKTEVVMTTNIREWRHFCKLRSAVDAHPQMREIVTPLTQYLQECIPVLFDDIKPVHWSVKK